MGNNELGLRTDQSKIIQEANERLKSARVDYDFYSTPFEYKSVEAQSANHLFGNGKWKQACKNAFGPEVFEKHCEKYGNRPIDFKITSFITDQAKYFQAEEKINITDSGNRYTGNEKVLTSDKGRVIVMIPFQGNSTGKISNVSRMLGAKKATDRFAQVISDFLPEQKKDSYNKEEKEAEKEKEPEQVIKKEPVTKKTDLPVKKTDGFLVFLGIIAAIILIAAFMKYSSKKSA